MTLERGAACSGDDGGGRPVGRGGRTRYPRRDMLISGRRGGLRQRKTAEPAGQSRLSAAGPAETSASGGAEMYIHTYIATPRVKGLQRCPIALPQGVVGIRLERRFSRKPTPHTAHSPAHLVNVAVHYTYSYTAPSSRAGSLYV